MNVFIDLVQYLIEPFLSHTQLRFLVHDSNFNCTATPRRAAEFDPRTILYFLHAWE